jgi:PAS domain S-box-containing protein
MSTAKKSTRWPHALAALLLFAATFVLDMSVPLGVAGGVPYMAPVLLSLWLPQRRYALGFAIAGTALTIIGYLLSPSGGEEWKVIFNRSLAVLVIWVAASLVLYRKMAEASLLASEEQKGILLQNYPDGIALTVGRSFAYVNPALCLLTGCPEGEMLGRPPEEFVVPEDREHAGKRILTLFTGEPVSITEYRILRKDGHIIPVEAMSRLIDYAGTAALLSVVRDITQRKQAEIALRESEERFRTLSASAPIGIFRTDAAGKFTYANQALQVIFGLTSEEFLAGDWGQVAHPDDRDRVSKAWTEAVREEREFSNEYRLVTRQGAVLWVSERGRCLFSDEGKPAGYVGTMEDITQRKWAEGQLEYRIRELALFPQLNPAPVLRFDLDGVILSANPAAVAILGERVNEPISLVSLLPSMENLDLKQCIQRGLVMSHEAPVGNRYFHFVFRGEPDLSIGQVYGSDITDRKAAEDALKESEESARRLAHENEVIAAIGRIVSSSLNLDEVFEQFSEQLHTLFPFERILVSVVDLEEDTFTKLYLGGTDVADPGPAVPRPLAGTQAGAVVRAKASQHIRADDRSELVSRFPGFARNYDAGMRSFLSVPLVSSERVIGVLNLRSSDPYAYSDRHIALLDSVANQIAGTIAIAQLYAERKRAEEALRESEERFRRIFERSNDAILLIDPSLDRIIDANHQASAMLGYSPKELFNLHPAIIHGNDLPQLREFFQDVIETGDGWTDQLFCVTRAGDSLSAEISASSIDIGGRTCVVALVRDITERKSLEEQLRKVSQAVEQSPFAVVITDVNGIIEYVNPSYPRVTGYTGEEVRGKTPKILNSGLTTNEQYQHLWSTILAGDEWRGELRNRQKNGDLYWAMETISPVRDPQGAITHFVAVQEDITERKSLEEQLLQSRKMESMGQLASGVAHDFNNMLTAIVGYARLSGAALPPGHPISGHLQSIMQAADRATNLTRQLLVFSRRQSIEPKVFDLNDLVIDFDKMLRRLLEAEIELVVLLAADPVPLKTDSTQMEQILMNLAINARDSMPDGGKFMIETANVALDAEQASQMGGISPGQYVMLTASDTGKGMSDEVRPRIFEPFFTTKEIGKGTGLGLATCYGAVKQNGGHIEVLSDPGRGTTFKIYIPRAEELAKPLEVSAGYDRVARGTETVLLAEDEPLLLNLVSYELRDQGYHVLEAANGEEALRVAKGYNGNVIHALVTDIVMPRMGGIELAERFKAGRQNAKVIFMSGYTDKAVFDYAAPEPGIAFLQKPFLSEALTSKLRELLDT